MAEEVRWLKGQLVGTCIGKPHRKVGGSGLARWYSLRLVDATISDWTTVDGPPKTPPGGQAPFCQAELKDARLRSVTAAGTDEALSLGELSVWDWKMRDQREGGGESRCTLVGTVYAREVNGTRRPAGADDEGRLGRWGCLALLFAMLIALWLWWSCGPFTCGLWAAVVMASVWSHRARTRRRTPPALWSRIVQSLLALLLILGGVGLTIGLADPAHANTCWDLAAVYVLGAVAVVVAGSLLTVSWQLPWIWVLWTVIVIMWCGRSGTDCVGSWLKRAQSVVSPSAQRRGSMLDEVRRRISGEPQLPEEASRTALGEDSGSNGPDGGGTGSGGTGSGGTGSGGTGSGGTGSGGTGSGGTGSGGTGSGGTGSGGTGSGGDGGAGTTTGGAGTGGTGTGTGGTGSTGTGDANPTGATSPPSPDVDETPEAAREPRMSIEAAVNDPKSFLDGSTRVTLSGDLLFAFDEDALKPEAEPHLRQLARLLRVDPDARVLLEGHADTVGGDDYNQDLSMRRAQAVRSWLVQEAHINPLRIDTLGYGNTRPLVPASKSPAQQQPNRRVEVLILPR